MITYAQACDLTNREFVMLHDSGEDRKGARGALTTARRNGRTQTWKTRPGEFRIPVKIGFKGHGEITHANAAYWRIK